MYFGHSRPAKFKVTCPNEKANVQVHFIGKLLDLLVITCLLGHINLFIDLQIQFSCFLILRFLNVNVVTV